MSRRLRRRRRASNRGLVIGGESDKFPPILSDVSTGGVVGRNPSTWVSGLSRDAFVDDLHALAQTRSGGARLIAMSLRTSRSASASSCESTRWTRVLGVQPCPATHSCVEAVSASDGGRRPASPRECRRGGCTRTAASGQCNSWRGSRLKRPRSSRARSVAGGSR